MNTIKMIFAFNQEVNKLAIMLIINQSWEIRISSWFLLMFCHRFGNVAQVLLCKFNPLKSCRISKHANNMCFFSYHLLIYNSWSLIPMHSPIGMLLPLLYTLFLCALQLNYTKMIFHVTYYLEFHIPTMQRCYCSMMSKEPIELVSKQWDIH